MYLTKEVKQQIFEENSVKGLSSDTGSPEVQIALFTYRINHLNSHLKRNRKDASTKRGLLSLVGKRRKLLNYLMKTDIERYRAILKKQNIRK